MIRKGKFEEIKIGMKVKPYPEYECWYKVTNIEDDKIYYKKENEPIGYYTTKNQLRTGDTEIWYEDKQMTLF